MSNDIWPMIGSCLLLLLLVCVIGGSAFEVTSLRRGAHQLSRRGRCVTFAERLDCFRLSHANAASRCVLHLLWRQALSGSRRVRRLLCAHPSLCQLPRSTPLSTA